MGRGEFVRSGGGAIPHQEWLAPARCAAMGPPMAPRPRNATAMERTLSIRSWCSAGTNYKLHRCRPESFMWTSTPSSSKSAARTTWSCGISSSWWWAGGGISAGSYSLHPTAPELRCPCRYADCGGGAPLPRGNLLSGSLRRLQQGLARCPRGAGGLLPRRGHELAGRGVPRLRRDRTTAPRVPPPYRRGIEGSGQDGHGTGLLSGDRA